MGHSWPCVPAYSLTPLPPRYSGCVMKVGQPRTPARRLICHQKMADWDGFRPGPGHALTTCNRSNLALFETEMLAGPRNTEPGRIYRSPSCIAEGRDRTWASTMVANHTGATTWRNKSFSCVFNITSVRRYSAIRREQRMHKQTYNWTDSLHQLSEGSQVCLAKRREMWTQNFKHWVH